MNTCSTWWHELDPLVMAYPPYLFDAKDMDLQPVTSLAILAYLDDGDGDDGDDVRPWFWCEILCAVELGALVRLEEFPQKRCSFWSCAARGAPPRLAWRQSWR